MTNIAEQMIGLLDKKTVKEWDEQEVQIRTNLITYGCHITMFLVDKDGNPKVNDITRDFMQNSGMLS